MGHVRTVVVVVLVAGAASVVTIRADSIRIERLGLAPFYEVGSVADRLGSLSSARVHDSVGIGLRIGLERASIFRCDVGWSHEGSAVTIAYGLSF